MTSITIDVKGKTCEEVLDLLKTAQSIVQSNDWGTYFEHDVKIVNSGGEASLVIVNNEDKYHGVKVHCCE